MNKPLPPMPTRINLDGKDYIIPKEVKDYIESLGGGNEQARTKDFDKIYQTIRNTVNETGGMVFDIVAALELVKNELIFNNVNKVYLQNEFGLKPVPQKEDE